MKFSQTSSFRRLFTICAAATAFQAANLFAQSNSTFDEFHNSQIPAGSFLDFYAASQNDQYSEYYDPSLHQPSYDADEVTESYAIAENPHTFAHPEVPALVYTQYEPSASRPTAPNWQEPSQDQGKAVSYPFEERFSITSIPALFQPPPPSEANYQQNDSNLIAQTTPAEDAINLKSIDSVLNSENALPAQAAAPEVPAKDAATPIQQNQSPTPANPALPKPPTIITPDSVKTDGAPAGEAQNLLQSNDSPSNRVESINFNNVSMIEYIRFISRLSNKNFIFDEENLQFNVTIVSAEPTTVENLMAALLQELKIRDLSLLEQGNNIIIHRNPRIRAPARIVSEGKEIVSNRSSELVTRVFRLNTLDPVKASEIIRPLLSEDALVEVLRDTNNLIITDLVTTVNKIAQLIDTLDAPNSGVTIGQYVVRNAFVDSLVDLGTKILQPIAQGNPFVLVPHPVSNSIFIVSNSFIVEKALAILQNLDLNEGKTKILSLEGLQPSYEGVHAQGPGQLPGKQPGIPGEYPYGQEGYGPGGLGVGGIGPGGYGPGGYGPGYGQGPGGYGPQGGVPGYRPDGQPFDADGIPSSFPLGGIGSEGRFATPQGPEGVGPGRFLPGGIGSEGRSAIFDPERAFREGTIGSSSRWSRDLPIGHIERTLFFIYKLRYRKGDQIEIALRKIANSLQLTGTTNADLVAAINSSQWLESSNALIFTGSSVALEKVRELIHEVDVPLRQVFIEMLILDTTIDDSLSYGVDWINRFGGGQTTGEQGFLGNANPGFFNAANNPLNPAVSGFPTAGGGTGDGTTNFLEAAAYTAGIIGTHITHGGTQFSTIGALVRAIHTDTKANIILNPKIITEDNNPAEIFVGGTDRYKTQSITNDLGSLVTNNFQFIDVGTTLRVTPLIGNNGIVTLDIVQESTAASPGRNAPTTANNQDVNLVEVLTKSRSVTKVHVPNGFFVVMSGMIRDEESRFESRVPCLGGIPIIGALNKRQTNTDTKHNLMLFIRPLIIETDEDLEDITKRQQDVLNEKSKFRRSWNYEIDEGLNFLNLKPTDPDEIGCDE